MANILRGRSTVAGHARITDNLLGEFAANYYGTYSGVVTLVALLGFSIFLIFPVLTCYGMLLLYEAAFLTLNSTHAWLGPVMIIGGIYGSAMVFQLKPWRPSGIDVDAEKIPVLFSEIDGLRRHLAVENIQRTLIDGEARVKLVKTPGAMLPLRLRQTLVIGLPLLQCMETQQFRFLLARAVSKPQSTAALLGQWHGDMGEIWQTYAEQLSHGPGLFRKLPAKFFVLYADFFSWLSEYSVQHAVFDADVRALSVSTSLAAREALQGEYLVKRFLRDFYWPRVETVISSQFRLLPFAYAKLPEVYRKTLGKLQPASWLDEEIAVWNNTPGLTSELVMRFICLGFRSFVPLASTERSAAQAYLGEYQQRIISTVDMLWLNRSAERWGMRVGIDQRSLVEVQEAEATVTARLVAAPTYEFNGEAKKPGVRAA